MKGLFIFLFVLAFANSYSQEFIPLWPKGKMPNSKGLEVKDSIVNERVFRTAVPGLYSFFPPKDDNNGTAIIIFPGGGYDHITVNLSGFQLAKWFNSIGMSAFVVVYRLPTSPDLIQKELGPLQDAQRAIRIIRANSEKWGIKKEKIGIQGTSSGGHLAALLGTFADDISSIKDSLDKISFRPDFMMLLSPVIDLGKYAHKGSSRRLLGDTPSPALIEKYSPQNHVSAYTPPTFMAGAFNDKAVPPQNSLLFYQALLDKNVSASYHVFPQGGHSIGLSNNPGSTELWKTLFEMWLKEMGFNEPKKIK